MDAQFTAWKIQMSFSKKKIFRLNSRFIYFLGRKWKNKQITLGVSVCGFFLQIFIFIFFRLVLPLLVIKGIKIFLNSTCAFYLSFRMSVFFFYQLSHQIIVCYVIRHCSSLSGTLKKKNFIYFCFSPESIFFSFCEIFKLFS